MQRVLGISFGVLVHAAFAIMVWFLFWFLRGLPPGKNEGFLWIDALLALQFTIPHSVLLNPRVRSSLEQWIPSPFYGCFFTLVVTITLSLMISCWRTSDVVLAQVSGWPASLVHLGFYSSWFFMLYSMSLNGLGFQTGWTPWRYWMRGLQPPSRRFEPRSFYRWMRHPVYLSFLGLVWLTPIITLDRAILISVWTLYVAVGSCLKDRRLIYFLGDRYREYQSQVRGYPLIWFGPLARIPITNPRPALNAPLDTGTLASDIGA